MPTTEFHCPKCGAIARSQKQIDPGTMIRCPKCQVVSPLTETKPVAAPPPAPKVPTATASPRREPVEEPLEVLPVKPVRRPLPRDDFDDDDRPRSRRPASRNDRDDRDDRYDDEDRPIRTNPKKPKKKGTSQLAIVIGFFALMIIVGISIAVGAAIYDGVKKDPAPAVYMGPGYRPPGANRPINYVDNPNLLDPVPDEQVGPNDPSKLTSVPIETKAVSVPTSLKASQPLSNDPPPIAPNGLSPAVLRKVRQATVYVRVTDSQDRTGSGSGFFASSVRDLVVTNAHVVGMLEPDTTLPKKIEVFLHSGQSEEVMFRGEVLAVDRAADLAVIKIHPIKGQKATEFPEPLTIGANYKLVETQPLFVLGYPLGEGLGKEISINQTSIASFRKNAEGELDQIQVAGGMHPGNSGGPVVDAVGNLIGVAVAVIKGTTINFAIPSERVNTVLNGRVSGIRVGDPVVRGTDYAIPVVVEALDPMKKITGLTLDWWWGNAGDKVPPVRGTGRPAVQRTSVSMKAEKDNRYSAEIVVPTAVPEKKVMWFQPHYNNASDQSLFVSGVTKVIESPPELRPATINFQPQTGKGNVSIKSMNHLRLHTLDGGGHTQSINLEAVLPETVGETYPTGEFSSSLRFQKFDVDVVHDEKHHYPVSELNKAKAHVENLGLTTITDRLGNVIDTKVDLNGVPRDSQHILSRFAALVGQSVAFGSITFPNATVRPGQRWQGMKALGISTTEQDITTAVMVTYIYRGIRKSEGKELAVVAISGRVQLEDEHKGEQVANPAGAVYGTALIDLSTGRVARVNVTVDSTLGVQIEGERVQAKSRLETVLTRD